VDGLASIGTIVLTKAKILPFDIAIPNKLDEIINDLSY